MKVSQTQIQDFALKKLREWREDWGKGAYELFGARLDKKQEDVLYSVQYHPKTVVSSGTARGKDYVTAVASSCFLYFTPRWNSRTGLMIENTKVALTAPTDRQVKIIMMPEISRLFNKARQQGFDLPGKLNSNGIRTPFEEWFLIGFKADEDNHEAWTGFHAVHTMFAVTEASGLGEGVHNAIEGNLQGDSRLLLVFNNNTGSGYAANAMKLKSFKAFRLDSLDAPNVTEKRLVIPGQVDWGWVNGRVEEWCQIISESEFREEEGDFWWENDSGRFLYRPNDLFRVKVRGMAPKVSSGKLIPPEWIERAQERYKEFKKQGFKVTAPLRLGVDVAGMGRDSSSFVPRYGSLVEKIEMVHSGGTANQTEIAGKTISILRMNTDTFTGVIPQAFIDTIGEGAGVFSILTEAKTTKPAEHANLHFHSVKFSYAPEFMGNELKDYTGQYTFLNMRAYLFWAIRDWLNPLHKKDAMLPPDPELAQELGEIQWKFRSDGSIQIEEKEEIKKRLGRSPDKSDGLANTFYPVNDVDPRPRKATNKAKYFF